MDEYLLMMSRSLLLWENFLAEQNSDLRDAVLHLRSLLPKQDVDLPNKEKLWDELDKELTAVHKFIHTIQNREWCHTKLRVVEQLIKDIKALP